MLGSFSSIERGSILLHSPIKSFAKSSGSLGARQCGFYASSSIIAIVRGFRSSRALQLVAAQDYLALAMRTNRAEHKQELARVYGHAWTSQAPF
jgi:hypothetical protein